MTTPIILAGSEVASFEKLTGALRKAAEAAEERKRTHVRRWLLDATEGATELGVYLADGRWATVALSLDKARRLVEGMDYGEISIAGPLLADNLRALHESVVLLRHGRVRH